jgi:uncharacterized membrane protein YbhN (UPF0104 family)
MTELDTALESNEETQLQKLGPRIALVTLFTVVIYAALSAYSDLATLSLAMNRFRWSALTLALVLSLLNFGLRAVRWQYYLRSVDVRVSWFESSLVFLAGLSMTITPGKVGELFKAFLLKWTRDAPLKRTSAVIVAERLTDLLSLLLLGAWGAFALHGGWLIGSAILLGVAALIGIAMWRRLGMLAIGLCAKIPKLSALGPKLEGAYDSLHATLRPKQLLAGLALGTCAWFAQVVALSAIVAGFAELHALPLARSAFVFSGSLIAGVAALLPGGIGVAEASMAGLLPHVATQPISTAQAVAITLLLRAATLWWAIVVGAVATLWHRRLSGWAPAPAALRTAV